MANTNSYSENMARLTQAATDILEIANAVNETISGNDAEVIVNDDITFPSFQNVINRVERAERTISRFTEGKGVVETDDGTYRKIRVETISRPANDIGTLGSSTNLQFDIDPNWFFESLQYPRCIVKIDLAGKIEDDSDRVFVSRIIIDQDQPKMTSDVKSDILNTELSYSDLIEYLDNNYIEYKEDKDEIRLPLTYERYNGSFQVNGINLEKDPESGLNYTWYYLSGISYSTVNDNGTVEDNGNILQVGDYLRFNNTLFKIKAINQTEMKVRLEYNVGYDTVGLYDTLEFYNDPFKEKVVSIGICVNEIDVVYMKGVNEKFNLLSRDWSEPLAFDTNTLVNTSGENFQTYYAREVADFGRMWISQIKEGRLPAYGGKEPNAPTLNKEDLKVVQINTQLNVTLDSEKYRAITSEIASVKSNIEATRNTIASNKNKLMTEYNQSRRDVIKNSINTDTDKLNNFTTQFSSLVDELNTLLTEAGAINYASKYHVRGFFAIPEPQYTIDDGDNKEGKQEIIAFEIMYRYLHTDETGTRLNTFTYSSGDSSIKENGVFSDWCIMTSQTLEKQYNNETDEFEWKAETLDGTHVTINQIDIPIRSGEKVEIKARSVSESGYPYSPLKSKWSNSIIIDFPDNLMTDDSVTTILKSVKDDMTSVVLQETLSAAGIYTHISDSNSQYKHSAENIEYTETIIDPSTGESRVVTMSLAEKIRSINDMMSEMTNKIEGVNKDDEPTVTFEVRTDASIYGGQVKVSLPNSSDDIKEYMDGTIKDFAENTVIPYIKGKMT